MKKNDMLSIAEDCLFTEELLMLQNLKKLSFFSQKTEQELFDEYYQDILVDGRIMFVGCLLQRAARLFPDTIALMAHNTSLTYTQVYRKASAVSRILIDMGVRPRDKVVLLCENSIEFYLGYYGIWQTGAVVVPLNTFLHERELYHIINNAQPKVMIISDVFAQRLEHLDGEKLPPHLTESSLKNIVENIQEESEIEIPSLMPDELAALLYTSGTTGFPKGVMLSSKNILTNIIQAICRTDFNGVDRILAALPLFHSFAQISCVWGSFFLGATTIIVPHIDRHLLLDGIEKKPTIIVGVPALYGLFCLMKTLPFDSVRYFVCGGDALPDKIRISFELIYRRRIANGYGLTETSPLISVNLDDEILAPNTVGYVSIGISCSLRDEKGNEVKKGQKGILWVKGDNVMLGYYKAPDLTNEVLKDGWLNTGDWAYFDKKDRLVISGRHKDLIINKGFNIYPQEIENVLLSHPAVIQAAVVGKKDPDVGEVPVAFVVLREAVPNIIDDLKKLCKQHLARYKIPRQFYILKAEQLPLTPLKKIDKKRLRKEFLEQENH
jgi:long-chain acyl-CoA synthetase